ncbi:MAG: hypothetical protein OEZ06_07185 [Myxococcales bacterium]|nr:hypothetical protein [Myxococcales bacterium]
MASKQTKALWRLSWLLGLPLLAVTVLFSAGVRFGDANRGPVLAFERDYLAWTGLPIAPAPETTAIAAAPMPPPPPAPAAVPTPPPPPPVPVATLPSTDAALPTADAAALAEAPIALPPLPTLPPPPPAPAPGSLEQQRAVPVTLRVKVLVDERLAGERGDWLSHVQRTIADASRIYRADFGIELTLAGVVRWPRALQGLGGNELHADLRSHGREGAHVLLGFVADRLDTPALAQGAPLDESALNGAYALVTDPGEAATADAPFLRGTLRALGHLMGAKHVGDAHSEAYRLGSWMSDAPAPGGRPPWIDMDNRTRILQRKSRPFEGEPEADR